MEFLGAEVGYVEDVVQKGLGELSRDGQAISRQNDSMRQKLHSKRPVNLRKKDWG